MTICTGIGNLILSILLVSRLGLAGVALGTLIASTIVAFGFMLPYSMRIIGVSTRTFVKEAFLPPLLPVIPMVAASYFLRAIFPPSNFIILGLLLGAGCTVYVLGYLSLSAGTYERQLAQNFGNTSWQFVKQRFIW